MLKLRGKFGYEGMGVYWHVIETLYLNDGKMDADALRSLFGGNANVLEYCISIGLFVDKDGEIFSRRLNDEIANRIEKSEKAKKSAKARWRTDAKKSKDANAMRTHSERNTDAMLGEERRGEEIKLKKPTKKNDERTNERPTAAEQREEIKQWDDEDVKKLEEQFLPFATEVSDEAYAQKTWDQRMQLRQENRTEFYRKCVLFCTYMRIRSEEKRNKARVLFHEIAGFINDRGAMERALDAKDVAKRREFARQELGSADAVDEIGDIGNSSPEWE